MFADHLSIVEKNIRAACKKAGRNREDVQLIAVSKTKPIQALREAIDCGIHVFGENKVQELLQKQEEIGEKLEWHFIGHLQRNKVRQLVGHTCLIHSVDSIRLARQIEEESAKKEMVSHILIEINIANEESKFGLQIESVLPMIQEIATFSHVKVEGLMTIAPFVENPEENREYFKQMRKLLVDIDSKSIDNINMNVLSMGMTGDYCVAIEEGATMVRVGTGLFGARDYTI